MFSRRSRLRELFLQELNAAMRDVKDPGMSGFITVTDLELGKDAKSARVYFSLLGSEEDRAKTLRALERSAEFLRQRLYARLRIKYVPRLIFKYDDTPEAADRIENLLNKIKGEETEDGPDRLDDLASRASKRSKRRRR